MAKRKEECGVFGIYNYDGLNAAQITYYGLFALQHRGQESCGIATFSNNSIHQHKNMGLVNEVFDHHIIKQLNGEAVIGHVRYSTTGASHLENAQPLVRKHIRGPIAIAHNGNLINNDELRLMLEQQGAIFQTTIDSEVIISLIAKELTTANSIEEAVSNVIPLLKGSFCLVILADGKLIAARDPWGIRPLCLGKIQNSYVVSSESCALDTVNADFVRDIAPGEIVVIDQDGIKSNTKHANKNGHICIFEYIYFARPDSIIDSSSVYNARIRAGKFLARDYPVDADVVVGIPDSGLVAALGYAQESGIPYEDLFVKNRYIGRTFIHPEQGVREQMVKIKLNILPDLIYGKKIVLVDDSIVRGTTIKRIVDMLKSCGAKEVHMRVSAPPFMHPCYFGTDIPSRSELIACNYSLEEIRQKINVDTLGYLKTERLTQLANRADICQGCFTGKYPMPVPQDIDHKKYTIPFIS